MLAKNSAGGGGADNNTDREDEEMPDAPAPAVQHEGTNAWDTAASSVAQPSSAVDDPSTLPESVLESIDPKFKDYEQLEKLTRANCGDHAFDAYVDWMATLQAGNDTLEHHLGSWREVKQRDRLERQKGLSGTINTCGWGDLRELDRLDKTHNKVLAMLNNGGPKKAWMVNYERKLAEMAKKEAERLADLQNSICWSADFARYMVKKRSALADARQE